MTYIQSLGNWAGSSPPRSHVYVAVKVTIQKVQSEISLCSPNHLYYRVINDVQTVLNGSVNR